MDYNSNEEEEEDPRFVRENAKFFLEINNDL